MVVTSSEPLTCRVSLLTSRIPAEYTRAICMLICLYAVQTLAGLHATYNSKILYVATHEMIIASIVWVIGVQLICYVVVVATAIRIPIGISRTVGIVGIQLISVIVIVTTGSSS